MVGLNLKLCPDLASTLVNAGPIEVLLAKKRPLSDSGSFRCVWPIMEKFLDRREGCPAVLSRV